MSIFTPIAEGAVPWSDHHLVLLDFWAPWCQSCKAMFPHLEKIIPAHPANSELKAFKVNADEEFGQALCGVFGVTSLPTLILLKDGKVVAKVAGFMNHSQINDFLESA